MVSPIQHIYNRVNFATMKVKLTVKKQSNVIAMANCPKGVECDCGINYRSM